MTTWIFAMILQLAWAQSPTPVANGAVPTELLTDPGSNPKGISEGSNSVPQVATFAEDYSYDPTGRRDPFNPPRSFLRENGKLSNTILRPKSQSAIPENADPLQRLDLDRINLVGIIWEVANPRAMVVDPGDPSKTIFVLQRKTKVGRNNGYVSVIREGEVVIIESFEEDGVINQVPRVLTLRKDQK